MSEEIRVLAVRQPWASLIVEGLKTIEVRSKPTNIRGKVAIYASTKKPTHEEISELFHYFGDQQRKCYDNGGHVLKDKKETFEELGKHGAQVHSFLSNSEHKKLSGKIIGTVEIFDCVDGQDFSSLNFDALQSLSLAPTYMITNDAFYWRLENAVKFTEPIPYKPPKGAVVWSKTTLPEV